MKKSITLFLVVFCNTLFASLVSDSSFEPKIKISTFKTHHPIVCMDLAHMNNKSEDGRYAPIFGLLESDGYSISKIRSKFNISILKNCDVLYISAVMTKAEKESAFSTDEIKTIHEWVQNGGSLLLMTDHPTILAEAPEELANAFGVHGSDGTTQDPNNTIKEIKDPSVIVFNETNMNLKHPIILGRSPEEKIKQIIAFTGQSLKGPKQSESVISFSDSAVNFYKNDKSTKSAMGQSEIISLRINKGRVVIAGDGTIFTSKIDTETKEKFGINRNGTDNVQLALNVFHWLSKILN